MQRIRYFLFILLLLTVSTSHALRCEQSYDANCNLSSKTDFNGQTGTFAYKRGFVIRYNISY